MKSPALGRLVAAIPLVSAAYAFAPPAEAASGRISVKAAGQVRSAYVVERYRAKLKLRPTIIVLGESGRVSAASRSKLRFQRFTRRGGVLVYAEAAGSAWTIGANGVAASEAAYLRALIAHLRRNSLSDPRRIYLVGAGAGGVVALQAACQSPRRFAGVAAALASLPKGQPANCKPSRPANVMLIAGDADKRTPFAGGQAGLIGFKGELAPVRETLQAFARAAACPGKVLRSEIPDRNRADSSRVTLERQSGCRARVSLARVHGGGHFLPGRSSAPPTIPGQNRDVLATDLITAFFRL